MRRLISKYQIFNLFVFLPKISIFQKLLRATNLKVLVYLAVLLDSGPFHPRQNPRYCCVIAVNIVVVVGAKTPALHFFIKLLLEGSNK